VEAIKTVGELKYAATHFSLTPEKLLKHATAVKKWPRYKAFMRQVIGD
jgi:hypothetical protein